MTRPKRRSPSQGRATRVPVRPVAVRGGAASASTASALRRSRIALQDIEGQLGRLLAALRGTGGVIDNQAPDRLRSATAEATAALASLAQFRDC